MRESRSTLNHRMRAGLVTGLLLAMCTATVQAQPADQSRPSILGYDRTHEITVNGTIKSVVSRHVLGSPIGLHLLITTPEGIVDAHLGPYLSRDTQAALQAGLPVQIVGAMERAHGGSWLLARQVIFAGRLVTVRGESGFLVHANLDRSQHPRAAAKSGTQQNGGAQ